LLFLNKSIAISALVHSLMRTYRRKNSWKARIEWTCEELVVMSLDREPTEESRVIENAVAEGTSWTNIGSR